MGTTKKNIKAKCPRCGKEHISYLATKKHTFEWKGRGDPRLLCLGCKESARSGKVRSGTNKGTTKERTTLLSIVETRGITHEQKEKHDSQLELLGRKLRAEIGVKAPYSWNTVFDSYSGRYGGVY